MKQLCITNKTDPIFTQLAFLQNIRRCFLSFSFLVLSTANAQCNNARPGTQTNKSKGVPSLSSESKDSNNKMSLSSSSSFDYHRNHNMFQNQLIKILYCNFYLFGSVLPPYCFNSVTSPSSGWIGSSIKGFSRDSTLQTPHRWEKPQRPSWRMTQTDTDT